MKEYQLFLNEYKKVGDEILEQETPLEVVKIIEENLPRLHDLSENLKPYLSSINELPVNIKSEKRFEIYKELISISTPISNLKNRFKTLFNTKGNKYYRDSEIDSIIDLFCHYAYSIPDTINTTILYESKNNEFILTRNKIERQRETLNQPNLNDYLRILIKYKGDKTKLLNAIKPHIVERNHSSLKHLIDGGDIGKGKIIYHGEAKDLITHFKDLYHSKKIQSRYTTIINWLKENFKFYHNDEPKDLNIDTIKKYFRKN